MDHLCTNSTAPLDTHPTLEPSGGSIHRSSQAPPLSLILAQEPLDHFDGLETICGQQAFYDEKDFLSPSCNLTNEALKNRKEGDVVIFDYPLSRADGNPPIEESGSSIGRFSEGSGIFFKVSKDRLTESELFKQIISPANELRLMQSRGPRLAIIDFPQCYDTHDDNLLNSIAKELHIQNATSFGAAHSKRVLGLPGRGGFRIGLSLRVPSKEPLELPKSGLLEDEFTFFVSFPYFGKSSCSIPLGPESESVRLLDFKYLGVDFPDRTAVVNEERGDDIGEILVHQARYMIFDNHTIATFRSKEDCARNWVPLHRFQERIDAFRATIQMIANRMDPELWALGKLQASLCNLERDIDQMISDAKIYEDNQGMERTPDDNPKNLVPSPEMWLPRGVYYEQARQNNVQKRKQRRVRDLLTSLNRLSASFSAAISVTERQIAILQDLHDLYLISHRTKIKDCENGYPPPLGPFLKGITPTPILCENSQQIDIIDEVIRERRCFVKKIQALVENMEARSKILYEFLRSDNAKAAAMSWMKQIEDVTEKMRAINERQGLQSQTLFAFTVMTISFLPLSLLSSYFRMTDIELNLPHIWPYAGLISSVITLLTAVIILWKHSQEVRSRSWVRNKGSRPFYGKRSTKSLASPAPDSQGRAGNLVSVPNRPGPPETAGIKPRGRVGQDR